jgi:hypothetical protein
LSDDGAPGGRPFLQEFLGNLRKPIVPPLALNLITDHLTVHIVSQRLKSLLALWFISQIALPFTAPLLTCDLGDLLGTKPHHNLPGSRDEGTRPVTPSESESEANSFLSPFAASSLRASTSLAVVLQVAFSGPLTVPFGLSPSPQVQHAVLRV